MGQFTDNVAPMRDINKSLAALRGPASAPSNQTQMTEPVFTNEKLGDAASEQEQETPNVKGTGVKGRTSAVALAGKRRLAIKLPANYN